MTSSPAEILRWEGPRGIVLLGAGADGRLELRSPRDRPGRGVPAAVGDVLAAPPDRGHPLARIVRGLASEVDRPIVDATAGLGGDAAVAAIASPGRRILACERHPLLAAVLEHEVRRARRRGFEPATRIDVRPVDAARVLDSPGPITRPITGPITGPATGAASTSAPALPPALVILDPMFPPRRKASALPPKPMQRIRDLAETPDPAAAEGEAIAMLELAAAAGADRIVLKRPPEAGIPESRLGRPTFEIRTKLVRWMVWERAGVAGE